MQKGFWDASSCAFLCLGSGFAYFCLYFTKVKFFKKLFSVALKQGWLAVWVHWQLWFPHSPPRGELRGRSRWSAHGRSRSPFCCHPESIFSPAGETAALPQVSQAHSRKLGVHNSQWLLPFPKIILKSQLKKKSIVKRYFPTPNTQAHFLPL